jgi:hypothetical protein
MQRGWLSLLVAFALGCKGDEQIAERLAEPQTSAAWSLSSSPVLAIGEEGVAQYELGDIIGLGKLDSDEWVLYDRAAHQLRFYDRNGRFLRSSGRDGEGPGEFRSVYYMQVVAGRTIYVYDQQLRRLSRLNSRGKIEQSWALFVPTRAAVLRAIGQVDDTSFVWMNFPIARCAENAIAIDSLTYYRFDIAARGSDEVEPGRLTPIVKASGRQTWGSKLNVTGQCLPSINPFVPHPLEAIAPGVLVVAERSGVKLTRYRFDDGQIEHIVIPIARRPLLRPVIDAEIDRRVSATPRDELGRPLPRSAGMSLYERSLREMPYPDSLPAVDQLVLDADGLIWLRAFALREDSTAEWTIANPDGSIAARLSMPARFRVFEIGLDYVAGIERDDLDVQRVVVRSLTRGR